MLGVLIGCGTFASIPILSELACTVDFDVADTLSGLSKKMIVRKIAITCHKGPYSIAEPFALVLIAN